MQKQIMFQALVSIVDTMDMSEATAGCHLDAYAHLLERTESPSSVGAEILTEALEKKISETEDLDGPYKLPVLKALNRCLRALRTAPEPFYDFTPKYSGNSIHG